MEQIEMTVKIAEPSENDFTAYGDMQGWMKARGGSIKIEDGGEAGLNLSVQVPRDCQIITIGRLESFGWTPLLDGETWQDRRERIGREDGRHAAVRLMQHNREIMAERLMVLEKAVANHLKKINGRIELAEERDTNPLDGVSVLVNMLGVARNSIDQAILDLE